jgi:ATP phosphoribosyltransferase regulatory subunit
MDEKEPLRFCYEGSAFSNTSNLQGKLKETTQMGAELMNDGSAQADGEMIAMLIECWVYGPRDYSDKDGGEEEKK